VFGGTLESVTFAVKVYVPTETVEAGVPVIEPVLAKVKPLGNVLPEARLQVRLPFPPAATRFAKYVAFCVTVGRVGKLVIASELGAGPLPVVLTL
jgi:hypothetical protein